jgi:predicted nucleic acid-binding Zn ribbon protein
VSGRADYVRHAKAHGVDGVLETAAGELDDRELAVLAAELRRIDPKAKLPVSPARPVPAAGDRTCASCGGPLDGRADRRTCSDRCRQAHRRKQARERDTATLPPVDAAGRGSVSPSNVSVTPGPRR